MSSPYLGEVRVFSFNFPPSGWALCNGQLLSISQNAALFSLLGTNFGGNGTTTFGLPNLQGATPVGQGGSFVLGAAGGEANHTLTLPETPGHSHQPRASNAAPTTGNPAGAVWTNAAKNNFTTSAPTNAMSSGTIANAGSSQPHQNTPPYLVVTFCIALVGIYPTQN
jgi:microcystin-dependent protein